LATCNSTTIAFSDDVVQNEGFKLNNFVGVILFALIALLYLI